METILKIYPTTWKKIRFLERILKNINNFKWSKCLKKLAPNFMNFSLFFNFVIAKNLGRKITNKTQPLCKTIVFIRKRKKLVFLRNDYSTNLNS